MYLITIIILLVIIFAIWYSLRRVESFIDATAPASALDNRDVVVPPVDYNFAMSEIGNNLIIERNLISKLVPYYEKLIGIAANNKVDPSKFSSKDELITAVNREKPAIRAAVDKEGMIPLYDIDVAQKTIANLSGVPDEVKYIVSYMYLPLEVELYRSTIEFLNSKCLGLLKYFSSTSTDVSGLKNSTPQSLGATISGFQDLSISSASIKAKGNLQNIINQYTVKDVGQKKNIGPDEIQNLYRISATRIRKLQEFNLDNTILNEMITNFGKLDQLIKQLEQGNDKAFAAIMVDGKSPMDAINAFTDYGTVPFAYLNYRH